MSRNPQSITLELQALLLAQYLLRAIPDDRIVRLYVAAAASTNLPTDTRLVDFGFRHPKLLKTLDSGLALISPNHELRRRIFIMFALLEASPEYSNRFLPVNRTFLYLLVVGLRGLGSLSQAALGVLIIKIGRFA